MLKPALVPGQQLPAYTVTAFNYAEDSENHIHNTEEAQKLGFSGGLVPGIGVYAYMTHPVVAALGSEWLEKGFATAKFIKPVYHGGRVTVHARIERAEPAELSIELHDGLGKLCAAGRAGFLERPAPPPCIEGYPPHPLPALESRKPARLAEWPAGTPLGSRDWTLDLPLARATFNRDMLESLPIYEGATGACHPALLLAQANYITRDNMKLGPWIHAASEIHNFAAPRDAEALSLRGSVAEAFEKRGHEWLILDLALVGDSGRPIQTIRHTAIIHLNRDN